MKHALDQRNPQIPFAISGEIPFLYENFWTKTGTEIQPDVYVVQLQPCDLYWSSASWQPS